MEAQVSQLTRLPCDDRLAYICQKPAKGQLDVVTSCHVGAVVALFSFVRLFVGWWIFSLICTLCYSVYFFFCAYFPFCLSVCLSFFFFLSHFFFLSLQKAMSDRQT